MIKNTPLYVLGDGIGFVELQDVMGNDLSIVNAARVSYLGHSKGSEADKKLLFYLMEHNHTSPFEMVEFRLRVKCPLFVARQWMRHRTWSYNEVSRRYTDEQLEFYLPKEWRTQSYNNKQMSEPENDPGINAFSRFALMEIVDQSLATYNSLLATGIAREQARMVLPQNMYTEFIAKTDAHNLMHFISLRMSSEAQYEIQLYAKAIYDVFLRDYLPWTFEAFTKFKLSRNQLTPLEHQKMCLGDFSLLENKDE